LIEIHESALPKMVEGVAVLVGKRDDGLRCFVARSRDSHAWGLTALEAVRALKG
jgi:hypothetical protein